MKDQRHALKEIQDFFGKFACPVRNVGVTDDADAQGSPAYGRRGEGERSGNHSQNDEERRP